MEHQHSAKGLRISILLLILIIVILLGYIIQNMLSSDFELARLKTATQQLEKERSESEKRLEKEKKESGVLYDRYLAQIEAIKSTIVEQNPNARMIDFIGFPEACIRLCNLVGIDLSELIAHIIRESSFDPNLISEKGAIGLLQMKPETARDIEKDLGEGWGDIAQRLKDPIFNICVAQCYLLKLQDKFNSRQRAYEGYLIGDTKLGSMLKEGIEPQVTKEYLNGIMAIKADLEKRDSILGLRGIEIKPAMNLILDATSVISPSTTAKSLRKS